MHDSLILDKDIVTDSKRSCDYDVTNRMGRGEEQLLQAARLQDVPLVQKLIHRGRGKLLGSSKKVNLNYQDSEGFSALHQAAVHGNTDITYALLDGHANIDLRDKKGLRPLHYAAWKGKVEVVSALLGSGASCNLPASNGCAPLHLATQYGHAQVCKMLLQYGADMSARQSDGCSPLDLACEFGRREVVDFFLHYNESLTLIELLQMHNTDSDSVSSPLHLAARNGHIDIVRVLLQSGVDINWRTAAGSCLHEAVANEKPEIVQLLIDCGIDVTIRSGLGQTALDLTKKLNKSSAVVEITRKLTEAQPRFLQVYAINDFQNILDRNSLAFTKGAIITVLEQNPNGNWKGRIDGANGEPPTIGTFPASFVQPYRQAPTAGSVDSGISPHDDESPPQWSNPHASRPSVPTSKPHLLPSHNYINLDPRSKQSQVKVPLVAPNVVNPSYEDIICSQPDRPIKKEHVSPERSIKKRPQDRPIIAPRPDVSISRNRPSISNPGYEDILIDQGAGGDASNHGTHTASGRSGEIARNIAKRASSKRAAMQGQGHDTRLHHWLASFGMEQYAPNFLHHGYDLPTAARVSPADLSAIRVVNPAHRKVISDRAAMLKGDPSSRLPYTEQLPRTLWEWLHALGLDQYTSAFAKGNVDSVEKAAQTTWEDLQEMNVTKLGHQKKLLIAIANLAQTMKKQTHNPPPAVRPKPGSKVEKPPLREKSSKPLTSSFKDTPELSSELQKALSRRQKIIDDADAGAPPSGMQQHNGSASEAPKPAAAPLNAVATGATANAMSQNVRQSSGSRGLPPNPPKRTSSISLDENPNHARVATNSVQDRSKFGSGAENVGPFKQTTAPSSRLPEPAPKPSVAIKTKPLVLKKPLKQLPQQPNGPSQTPPQVNGTPSVSKQPPPVLQKPSRNGHGAHFDLSALDGVNKSASATHCPVAVQPAIETRESGEDFEWPAPPPMQFEAPPADFPAPPPTQPETQEPTSLLTSSNPPTSVPSYFKEESGTVKRRPLSSRTDLSPTSPHPHEMAPFVAKTSPILTKKIVEQPPSLPVKSGRFSPVKQTHSIAPNQDDSLAPPLPEKVGKLPKAELVPGLNSPDADPRATREALDDITAMFDGLAQEFDDLNFDI